LKNLLDVSVVVIIVEAAAVAAPVGVLPLLIALVVI
jgi:hypothetical protein